MQKSPNRLLELSVVVPSRGRAQELSNLLARCDQQTIAPRRFELIVVDDASPQSLSIDPSAHRFALTLLRQEGAGPGAARNLGLAHCSGALVLFLDDDALPAFDLFEKHLEVHAARTDKVAVLGSFEFTSAAMRHPFVQILNDSDLLFDYVRMRDGALHPWPYFWTCNISLPLAALRDVGGFDAKSFPESICEDVELGFRLAKHGYKVLFREDLACEHDHVITADEYFARAVRQGVYSARLAALHGHDVLFARTGGVAQLETSESSRIAHALSVSEAYYTATGHFLEKMRRMESAKAPTALAPMLLSELRSMTRRLALVPFCRGQLIELMGFDPETVIREGPAPDRLTSIVVVSCDALEQTKACLERLRDTREAAHPAEFIFVDNGSSDGSAEYLAAQSDVRLLRNSANLGAPKARNQALPLARGEYVVFLDNDAMVTPDWLGRMLYHAEVDPHSGAVAPTTDRAAHRQQVAMPCAVDPSSIAEFARQISRDLNRQHFHSPVLASFCLLVSRRVLDAIGGFDERFTPHGYEDDDFTLRATLAGFRNRCARDVFVRREPNGGRYRLECRSEVLSANWDRFAAKWGLGPDAASKGDSRLAPILAARWLPADLRIPVLCGASQTAPLPQTARQDQASPKT